MKHKIFFTFLLLLPMQAAASAAQDGLDAAAAQAGLNTDRSVIDMIAIVINAILSLLAMIFIVLIILGGFRWMTSAGNATKVDSAKQTISNAVIGLVIVVAAYAIATFVLGAVVGSTSGGGVTQP
ncbi:hypothetical protein HOD19_02540 [bacterium]|jgi:hypothetical protein|nr:hypothetical protein [bacterium]MBT4649060.1 hypothetical protein [bacterium]